MLIILLNLQIPVGKIHKSIYIYLLHTKTIEMRQPKRLNLAIYSVYDTIKVHQLE